MLLDLDTEKIYSAKFYISDLVPQLLQIFSSDFIRSLGTKYVNLQLINRTRFLLQELLITAFNNIFNNRFGILE